MHRHVLCEFGASEVLVSGTQAGVKRHLKCSNKYTEGGTSAALIRDRGCIIQVLTIKFRKPNYLGDTLLCSARVAEKIEAYKTIVLKVKYSNIANSNVERK